MLPSSMDDWYQEEVCHCNASLSWVTQQFIYALFWLCSVLGRSLNLFGVFFFFPSVLVLSLSTFVIICSVQRTLNFLQHVTWRKGKKQYYYNSSDHQRHTYMPSKHFGPLCFWCSEEDSLLRNPTGLWVTKTKILYDCSFPQLANVPCHLFDIPPYIQQRAVVTKSCIDQTIAGSECCFSQNYGVKS